MAKQILDEPAAAETPPPAPRKKTFITVGILVGIMLAEGAAVFFLARHVGGQPQVAAAADLHGLDSAAGKRAPVDQEVEVVKFRAQNEKGSQPVTYEMSIAAVVSEEDQAKVAEALGRKKATIQDRLSRIVRSLDPQRFAEPDLSTLRQQFKHELGQIVDDEDAIKEVLLPSFAHSEN